MAEVAMIEPGLDVPIKQGLRWTALRQIMMSIASMGAVVLYARFLTPDALGAASLALLVYLGLYQLVRAPFGHAVIYYQEDEREHASAAFWLLMAFSTVATALVLAFTPWMAQFYASPLAAALTRIITLEFFILSLAAVPAALLIKQMRFRVHEILLMVYGISQMAGWVILALLGFGAWSLILPGVLVSPIWLVGVWIATRFRPMLRPGRRAFRDIFRFARSLWGSELLTYLMAKVDNAAVGALGTQALGFYAFGEDNASFAVLSVADVIAQVTLPALARLQRQMDAFRQKYLEMLRLTAAAATPMQVGAIIVADLTLTWVFGDQWAGAVPVLRAYLFFHIFDALTLLSDAVMSALGRPDIRLRYNLFQLPFFVAGAVISLRLWGNITSVAITLAVIRALAALIYLGITWRRIGVAVRQAVVTIAPSLAASGLMAVAALGVRLIAPPPLLLSLVLVVLAGVAAYGLLMWVIDRVGFIAVVRLGVQLFVPLPVRGRLNALLLRYPRIRRLALGGD